MSTVSERLAQEDELLRQIRLAISSLKTIGTNAPRRKGVMYASTPLTSGKRAYSLGHALGFTNLGEFKSQDPVRFKDLVMKPNMQEADEFGELLRQHGWLVTIVPGKFWAPGWGQTHYMSFWRTVINLLCKSICQNSDWEYSSGSAEEFLIALRCNMDGKAHKRMFVRTDSSVIVADNRKCADDIRRAIENINDWGFDPSPLYEIWREITLAIDTTTELARKTVVLKA